MNPYEREFFVSRIRSGIYKIKNKVMVYPPTITGEAIAHEAFQEVYEQCRNDGIMTEEEMEAWMYERGLWDYDKEQKFKKLSDDIESIKLRMYQSRNNTDKVDGMRKILRASEEMHEKLNAEKKSMFSKTCEGIALHEKAIKSFTLRCRPIGISPINDYSTLLYFFNSMLLNETKLREIARNEPWRSYWLMRENNTLFNFADRKEYQFTHDQKGLIIWSKMYDNVQESMECPEDYVIEDDDLLDGWFISQRREQQKNKTKSELSRKVRNQKIANSEEVMIFTDSKKEANDIHSLNDVHSNILRRQRIETAKQKGRAVDLDFQDRRLDLMNKIRRKRR